jgi:phospholipase/lecithinase/hemolysin
MTRFKPLSRGNASRECVVIRKLFTEAREQLPERHQGLNKEISQHMHRLKPALLLLSFGALLAQVAPEPGANSRPYTVLYVFGDSYSDSGAGYVDANGPTAVVYLAEHLGIPFTYDGDQGSAGKGLNFAVSGASSGDGVGRRLPSGGTLGFGMKNQIDNFVRYSKSGAIPKIDAANTMFFFAGGLNDGRRPDGFVRTNIESEIDTLYELGARRFMVAILPIKIPQFAAAGRRVNPELEKIPGEERVKHPDIRIANSQWGSFFDEVITNPAKFGLADTATPCSDRPFGPQKIATCTDPDAHFFYHEGHPSTAAHRAVGELLYREAITKAP